MNHHSRSISFFLALASIVLFTDCVSAQRQATPQRLLLTNAMLVDTAKFEVRKGALLIENGVLKNISDSALTNFDGETLDLGGRWVIPGFVDMHVHAFGNRAPGAPNDSPGFEVISNRVLLAGVTGFVDLFGDEDELLLSREHQRSGDFLGADIYASLSCITAPGGHCSEYGIPTRTLSTPAQADPIITELTERKADVIKLVYQPSDDQPSIDKATMTALVVAATDAGLATIVHIKTWQDVHDVAEAGASAFTHMPSDPIPSGLPELLADQGIVSIPTLTVETDLVDFVFDPTVTSSPLARSLTTSDILDIYTSNELQARVKDRKQQWTESKTQTLRNVDQLHKAGVRVLAGTDSGNYGTIQGYSIHREMLKLTQSGLSNWQALAASTSYAREFLGLRTGFEPGAPASFVVLEASPLTDIENTQKIHSVIHKGSVVNLDEIQNSVTALNDPTP